MYLYCLFEFTDNQTETVHEKTNNLDLEKKRNRTTRVAKTKALISFAVTAKLICVFYREADLRLCFRLCSYCFSHATAQIRSDSGESDKGNPYRDNLTSILV